MKQRFFFNCNFHNTSVFNYRYLVNCVQIDKFILGLWTLLSCLKRSWLVLDSKPDVKKKLEMVSYSSRFAVGLFYNPGTKIGYTWGGKYIPEDSCIRFVAIENIKRNLSKFHRLCCILWQWSVAVSVDKQEVFMILSFRNITKNLIKTISLKISWGFFIVSTWTSLVFPIIFLIWFLICFMMKISHTTITLTIINRPIKIVMKVVWQIVYKGICFHTITH